MTSQTLLAVFLLALGGAAIAVQAPINAGLARGIGSAAGAAAVSFGVGFVALGLLTVVTGGAGGFAKLAGVPVWQLAGGLLGAYYVWSVITGIPTLGVVTAIAAMILGCWCPRLLHSARLLMSSTRRPSSRCSQAPAPPTTVGAFQADCAHQLCRTVSRSAVMQSRQ